MSTRRVQKVEELIKQLLSGNLREMLLPEMGIVDITAVMATADFKSADIYLSVLVKENEDKVLKFLNQQKYELQEILGQKMKIRYSPRLNFKIDNSSKEINKIEEKLKEIDRGS